MRELHHLYSATYHYFLPADGNQFSQSLILHFSFSSVVILVCFCFSPCCFVYCLLLLFEFRPPSPRLFSYTEQRHPAGENTERKACASDPPPRLASVVLFACIRFLSSFFGFTFTPISRSLLA
ncbi:hypothetical protein HDV64DRAFT_164008 [Trichoderma sp. TUCIM 5745]